MPLLKNDHLTVTDSSLKQCASLLGFFALCLLRCSGMSAELDARRALLLPQPLTVKDRAARDKQRDIERREAALQNRLSPRQVAMIGLGCTMGTGFFLGSAISVKRAGPAV